MGNKYTRRSPRSDFCYRTQELRSRAVYHAAEQSAKSPCHVAARDPHAARKRSTLLQPHHADACECKHPCACGRRFYARILEREGEMSVPQNTQPFVFLRVAHKRARKEKSRNRRDMRIIRRLLRYNDLMKGRLPARSSPTRASRGVSLRCKKRCKTFQLEAIMPFCTSIYGLFRETH